jgi:hypothetical protein
MSDADNLSVQWVAPAGGPNREPQLTIYSNLNGYINACADETWFAEYEAVDLGVVPDENLLVFRGDDHGQFSLSRNAEKNGADVSITATLKRHWPGLELDETTYVDLVERGNLVVADLSPLLPVDDDQSSQDPSTVDADDANDAEGDAAATCPDCGNEFKNEAGLNIHLGQTDCWLGDEPTESGESDHDDAAVPDPDDAPSLETVRDCAEQVDTLPELADLLDMTEGETRLLARQADVYGDLEEDVRPMGAGG